MHDHMTVAALRRRFCSFDVTADAAFVPLCLTPGVAEYPSVVHKSIVLRGGRVVKFGILLAVRAHRRDNDLLSAVL